MSKAQKNILVVDDEQDLLEIITFNLEGLGYQVESSTSAIEALSMDLSHFDLLILDVMMHGMSGFKMAEVIRKTKKLDVPIIFLTAKNTENDMLTGFSLGADDYVAKPFSIKELQARVNAVLTRSEHSKKEKDNESEIAVAANLTIDILAKNAIVDGEKLALTKKEHEILLLLVQNIDRVFSRDEILDRVWRGESYVMERTVDVHIARLRKKLQKANLQIINRSGFGYCLVIS